LSVSEGSGELLDGRSIKCFTHLSSTTATSRCFFNRVRRWGFESVLFDTGSVALLSPSNVMHFHIPCYGCDWCSLQSHQCRGPSNLRTFGHGGVWSMATRPAGGVAAWGGAMSGARWLT
jgi:hypothetical protein